MEGGGWSVGVRVKGRFLTPAWATGARVYVSIGYDPVGSGFRDYWLEFRDN